ncbi:MAG TPA: FeoB-associated Cys-rich membrane protein [Flexilinea sp.]|nr:FeoB-associated Cys-rich membrane protein [Flexilinea sp.]HNY20062.1 FeoB-associated Cys-rich membrane protein [Flexilinea sp.]HOW07560.1 FeoB-associated Cys-rich membrane protein [Flexilinea sp.]HPS48472.1 FeoB-associated Cys-rich membrane protein [Flexilinea sp.]
MADWIVGFIVVLLIGWAIYHIIQRRKNPLGNCGGSHSIYGIPDSEIPSYCSNCRARELCRRQAPKTRK